MEALKHPNFIVKCAHVLPAFCYLHVRVSQIFLQTLF